MVKPLYLVLLLPLFLSCSNGIEDFSVSQLDESVLKRAKANNSFSSKAFDFFAAENMSFSDSQSDYDTLPGGVVVLKDGEQFIYQGDMVYYDSTLYRLLPPTRSYVNDEPSYYWPYGIVYYDFADNIPDTSAIKAAMNQISAVSSVVFQHKTSSTHSYIRFKKADVNNSPVGKQGGRQIINLYNYTHTGVVMHEILHSLGIKHEMCRTDRDNHVNINWTNIKPSMSHNFDIYSNYRTADVGPFDFNSIMMYGSYTNDDAFVYDTTEPMFLKSDGTAVYAQRSYLSSGDIEGLKSIYGPPFHRVERRLTVTEEDYYGLYEILEMDGYDYVLLYADENCTIRDTSAYPRQLLIQKSIETYYYGSYQGIDGYLFEVTIPAGVDSVYLGSYHNVENYASSNPYNISITQYEIVNAHVPSYTHPII